MWNPLRRLVNDRGETLQTVGQAVSLAEEAKTRQTLAEVLSQNDLVEVVENGGDPFIIVARRPEGSTLRETSEPDEITFADPRMPEHRANANLQFLRGEIGSSSPSPFTSQIRREYNAKLTGLQGLKVYDRMRRSDSVVRGSLRVCKTPVLSGRWFIEPASTKTADVNAAKFAWEALTKYMSISFEQVLTETLLMLDFGYYMFEKVWTEQVIDGQLRLTWQKLAPRHPMDVQQWYYDSNGGPASVRMYPPTTDPMIPWIDIPISKLMVFTFDREAGNIEGISVLRSAYQNWFYKDTLFKIDAIQKERHGIGVPVIQLPVGFGDKDVLAANELGRNLRSNEKAHVVLPPNWVIMFAEIKGQPVDALKSVAMHNEGIRENVLAGFLGSDHKTDESDQTLFLKATRFVADIVRSTFNLYAIPELINANFSRVGMPVLRVRRIGEIEDQRTLSFAVRNLIGAQAIRPDDKLEEYLRDQMDLPAADPATARFPNERETVSVDATLGPNGQPIPIPPGTGSPTGAPQQKGAQAGMPRQKQIASAKMPAANGGTDRSGK